MYWGQDLEQFSKEKTLTVQFIIDILLTLDTIKQRKMFICTPRNLLVATVHMYCREQ
jgi:hypothetical protein